MDAEDTKGAVVTGVSYWGLTARPCDACGSAAALLFCRADAAFLCASCDARAHNATAGGARHARVWLCEVCEHAPAAVTCKADAAALCVACDADIHQANPLARRHERHPVAPFLGPLATTPKPFASTLQKSAFDVDEENETSNEAEAASWLLPEPSQSPKDLGEQFLFGDQDAYMDLDFVRSMDGIKAIGVPSHPPELDLNGAAAAQIFYPDHSGNYSVSSSEAAVVPEAATAAMPTVSKGREREARLMRYREKRKSRRFEKTVRYASRKAYAETRPRIKGRFAKRTGASNGDAVDEIYSSAAAAVAALMADSDYGVVPSF